MTDSGHSCSSGGHHEVPKAPSHQCGCGGHHHAVKTEKCGCGGHASPAPKKTQTCNCKSLRLPRRLHAASAVVFGLFLIVHLIVNATALHPPAFISASGTIHSIIAQLPYITLFLVFLPLVVQIGSGLHLLSQEGVRFNAGGCNRGSTLRFFLQRISAIAVLIFVTLHLGTLHQWGWHQVPRHNASTATGYATAQLFPAFGAALSLLFLLGVTAMVYHLANGAITGAQVWGIIKTDRTKRIWRRLCTTAGVCLLVAGIAAFIGFGIPGLPH
ncbi:MAG: hypothetical protein WCD42_01740 [Rhizomicrobium sp.]